VTEIISTDSMSSKCVLKVILYSDVIAVCINCNFASLCLVGFDASCIQVVTFTFFRSGIYPISCCCCSSSCLGNTVQKSLRFHYFKLNLDENWQDCS